MDVWDYFDRCEREYAGLSLHPAEGMFAAEEESAGSRGRIFGQMRLLPEDSDVDAFLQVSEVVVCDGGRCDREEYAYYLVIDGVEVWGYEKDLSHDPPVHRHVGGGHAREAAEEISFARAATLAWEEVSNRLRGVRVD
jgi:hypothetical protein